MIKIDPKKSLFEKLDGLLQYVSDKNVSTEYFVFICSMDFECSRKEYKGYKIHFSKLLKKDTIHFQKSPFIEDYD